MSLTKYPLLMSPISTPSETLCVGKSCSRLEGSEKEHGTTLGVVADNREKKKKKKKKKKQRTSKRIYIGNLEGGSKKSRVGKAERDGRTNYRCAL